MARGSFAQAGIRVAMPSVSLPLQPLMVEQTNIANQSNVMGYTPCLLVFTNDSAVVKHRIHKKCEVDFVPAPVTPTRRALLCILRCCLLRGFMEARRQQNRIATKIPVVSMNKKLIAYTMGGTP